MENQSAPGRAVVARSARAAICPGVVSYEKAWLANSWDRFMIPKPFSRVLFRFGSILDVPETLSEDRFEALRKALEDDLIRAYAAADRHWQEAPGRLSLEGREAP
mgnify:CR=1 FL=1